MGKTTDNSRQHRNNRLFLSRNIFCEDFSWLAWQQGDVLTDNVNENCVRLGFDGQDGSHKLCQAIASEVAAREYKTR